MENLVKILKKPALILNRFYRLLTGINITLIQINYEGIQNLPLLGDKLMYINLDKFIATLPKYTQELGELFTAHGSDKATKHDYYKLYAYLLEKNKENDINILEIGLGTNNTSIPSNMTSSGKPGASLRAFRDYYEKANVFGADIDSDILFEESRIKTFFVDQTKPETFTELKKQLPKKFDLIIDDGLHEPIANINTVRELSDLVAPGGFLVVEDIFEGYLPVWQTALSQLPDEWNGTLVKCKSEFIVVLEKTLSKNGQGAI